MFKLTAGYNNLNKEYLLCPNPYGNFDHNKTETFSGEEDQLEGWVEGYLTREGIMTRRIGVISAPDPQEDGKVKDLVQIILKLNPKAERAEPLEKPTRKEH